MTVKSNFSLYQKRSLKCVGGLGSAWTTLGSSLRSPNPLVNWVGPRHLDLIAVPLFETFRRRLSQGMGTPPPGVLNARGVPNTAILDLLKAISHKRCKIGVKLIPITNRKSYMSIRLLPKLVTLNDLERCNGLYFALFHRIR